MANPNSTGWLPRARPGSSAGARPGSWAASLTGSLVVALAGLSVGCGPPPKDPALEGYERFVGAVRTGNAAEVWHRLTPASQKALTLRIGDTGAAPRPTAPGEVQLKRWATDLGLAVPDPVPAEPLLSVLGVRPGWQFELDLPQSAQLETATLTDERKVVVGPLGGARWRIPVLRVDGQWRVDLFAAAPADPPSGAGPAARPDPDPAAP